MERIGIYGGSFNPPHVGHIRAACYAMDALRLDKLLLIPAAVAPHKAQSHMEASAQHRMQMLRLAARGVSGIEVSDMELRRGGVSYTYETVAQLHRENPNAHLVLLVGADMFRSFPSWRCPEDIVKNAELAVLCRGDKGEKEQIEKTVEELRPLGARVQVLENPVTVISSTQLRRLLAFGCGEEFLSEGVGTYIRENGLYNTAARWENLPMEQLQQVVVSLLNPNRVRHVLGCREAAVELAKRYGADETDAARAALLHDITKALDGPLQLTICREYGIMLDKFSTQNPKTLHALTGSLVAQRIFGENDAVVSAIRSHTTGKANMNLLEKIIYVAEYMEPNRDFPGVERLRRFAYEDIDKALRLGLEMTLEMLRSQKREISPESESALSYLQKMGVTL